MTQTPAILDTDRMDLLRRTIANDAPQAEFELFVADCNRRGLDPFARQTYLIKRGGRWQQQTSIDGYRLIADRTGMYAGSDEPEYVTGPDGHPNKASVTVWKLVRGVRCSFTASARWDEHAAYFNGKLGDMWQRMPYLMLAKCAESAALRKAFPQELSGLYTNEEMQQADSLGTIARPGQPVQEEPAILTVADRDTGEILPESVVELRNQAMRRYFAVIQERGLTDHERKALQAMAYGVESATELSERQIRSLTIAVQQRSNEELRAKLAEAAQDAPGATEAADVDANLFTSESDTEGYLDELENAATWEVVQEIGREMAAFGISSPDLERAKAAAYNRFHPKSDRASTK